MPDDILDHPELRSLLREADSALALLREVGDEDPGNFAAALDHVYTDIGRLLHSLVPSPDAFEDEGPTAVSDTPPPFEDDSDEVTQVGDHLDPSLIADDPTDPSIDTQPGEAPSQRSTPAGPPRLDAKRKRGHDERVAQARQRRPTAPPLPRARIVTASLDMSAEGPNGDALWITQLGDLMELLALPYDLEDTRELSAEASRVQWSTVDLDTTWAPFPPAIQAALLGLMASRARHVQEKLEVDVGPRIALERLSEYRERAGLNKVQGLYAERPPQTASWAEDARQWWETLVEGLRGA